jgi:hypothetical protein
MQSGIQSPTPALNVPPQLSEFDSDLEAMRTADFNFIYVFRRKDGGVLDADDKRFMNATMPQELNRRTLSDGDKALIVGSNFRFPPAQLKLMTERYMFADFSKPENELIRAGNANANTNAAK